MPLATSATEPADSQQAFWDKRCSINNLVVLLTWNEWTSLESRMEMLCYSIWKIKIYKNYNFDINFIDYLRKVLIIFSLPLLIGEHPKYWYFITRLWSIENIDIEYQFDYIYNKFTPWANVWKFPIWKIENRNIKAWRNIIVSDIENFYLLPQICFLKLKIMYFITVNITFHCHQQIFSISFRARCYTHALVAH